MKLINSLKILYNEYARQYWLMITGIVLSTAGGSMIWPFLVIYASSKLNMPLSRVAALISINAGTGLIFSLDRWHTCRQSRLQSSDELQSELWLGSNESRFPHRKFPR